MLFSQRAERARAPATSHGSRRRPCMILAERAARLASEIAVVERLKLEVARLAARTVRDLLGAQRRIDQLELVLEDLEEETLPRPKRRRPPSPKRSPVRLPRGASPPAGLCPSTCARARRPSRPTTCACCGGARLRHLGGDVTETLSGSRRAGS